MRLPFNNIVIKRGRLLWLLRQEQMLHHLLTHRKFENIPETKDKHFGGYPKNSKPIYCQCEGCKD